MRRLILLITAVWLLVPALSWSYDLLIVQSQRSPAYDEVLRGIRSVARFSERIIVLSDYTEVDLMRIVREENPLAIVSLGDRALAAASKVRQTPIIALMALSYQAYEGKHPAMSGVDVQASPERYLPVFIALKASRVGILQHSANSAAYIRQARKVAAKSGIELVTREVKTSREVPGQLAALAGSVDAIWMLPDAVTSSREAADAHFLFSASHNIPVITLSSAYLNSGAAVAVDVDRLDMGRQAGEMALAVVNGTTLSKSAPESPRKTAIRSNQSILRRLGLSADLAELAK